MYRGIWEDGEGKPAHRLDWPSFTTAHPGRGWENPIPLPIVLFALLCAHRLTRVPARRSLSRTAGLGTNDFGGEQILLLFPHSPLFHLFAVGHFSSYFTVGGNISRILFCYRDLFVSLTTTTTCAHCVRRERARAYFSFRPGFPPRQNAFSHAAFDAWWTDLWVSPLERSRVTDGCGFQHALRLTA